jgi:hypothetical protein
MSAVTYDAERICGSCPPNTYQRESNHRDVTCDPQTTCGTVPSIVRPPLKEGFGGHTYRLEVSMLSNRQLTMSFNSRCPLNHNVPSIIMFSLNSPCPLTHNVPSITMFSLNSPCPLNHNVPSITMFSLNSPCPLTHNVPSITMFSLNSPCLCFDGGSTLKAWDNILVRIR